MTSQTSQTSLEDLIERFNDDFSNQRLDAVMEYFAEHAEFRDLNGSVAKGKNKIRGAFQRLFDGAFGKVTFIPKHLIIDETRKQASFVWACQHQMLSEEGLSFSNKCLFKMLKLRYGAEFYWHGIDYFVFDDDYKIVSKQTYGNAKMPQFLKGNY